MKEKIIIYESDYLVYELVTKANINFVLQEFKHLEELEESETGWDSYPEWLEYFSIRPIGNKPYLTSDLNININELSGFLKSNHLTQITGIEINSDERGIYASEIMNSRIYGNSDYCIIILEKEDVAEHLCIIPSEINEIKNLIAYLLNKYDLILVDCRARTFI